MNVHMDEELAAALRRREEVLDQVRAMLVRALHLPRPADEIDPDAPLFFTGLALDSLDAVELVVSLESEFGVRLPDAAAGRRALRTVNAVVDAVLAAREAARG